MGGSLAFAALTAAFDHAPDATLLVDGAGTIVAANEQAGRIFGYLDTPPLVGQSVEALVPAGLREAHRTHRSRFAARPEARPMGARLNLMARRLDGREFPVEIALSPVETDQGPCVVTSVRDITERVAAEAAVRRSEAQLRFITERASDMIYVRRREPDGSRPFEYVSPASYGLLGYTPEDFYERADLMDELLHPDDRPQRDSWRRAMGEHRTSPPLRYRRRDGSWVWVEIHISEIEAAGQGGARYEGLVRDVTERVEAEATERWFAINEQLQDERERIAHDLHDGALGALFGVGMELRALARDLEGVSPELNARTNATADELGEVSKEIRAYIMGLRPGRITRDLAGSVADLCEHFEATSGVRTQVQTGELPEDIGADAAVATFHVVQEALNNVRKHSEATAVEVGLAYDGRVLSAQVRDNGRGFDAFERPLVSSIGMRSMAHRAHSLGGELKVVSAPQRGTTVEVTIPVA